MICKISFHKTSSTNAKFVKCIKKDFGLKCKPDYDEYSKKTTWNIIGNEIEKDLTAENIFKLDKDYGILEFNSPNEIILR